MSGRHCSWPRVIATLVIGAAVAILGAVAIGMAAWEFEDEALGWGTEAFFNSGFATMMAAGIYIGIRFVECMGLAPRMPDGGRRDTVNQPGEFLFFGRYLLAVTGGLITLSICTGLALEWDWSVNVRPTVLAVFVAPVLFYLGHRIRLWPGDRGWGWRRDLLAVLVSSAAAAAAWAILVPLSASVGFSEND